MRAMEQRTLLFLGGLAALLLLTLAAALLWRRLYRDDPADTLRTVLKNSALPIAANLASRVVDFGFALVVLRLLGPTANGDYATVALAAGLYFVTISNWGLNDLTVREAAVDAARAPALFSTALLVRCGIAVLLCPLAALLAATYAALGTPLSAGALLALALLALHLFPAALASACSASFQAAQRMEIPAAVTLTTNVLRAGVGVLLLAWLNNTDARLAALGALALAGTLLNGVLLWWLQRRLLFRAPRIWDSALAGRLLREGFPLLLNGLLLAVFFRFDILIMRAVSDVAEVGRYDAAYKLINLTQIIPPYFVAALFPVLAQRAANDIPGLVRAYRSALVALQQLAWPAALLTTVLASDLIGLVGGREFLPGAASALTVLIWYLPLSYANGVVQYVLIAVHRQRAITVAFMVGAALNLGLNVLLIPQYGALAAAGVTISTEIVLLLAFARALHRAELPLPLVAAAWRPALGALAGLLAAYFVSPTGGWLAALAAAAVYGVVLWASGGVGPEERALARRVLAKVGRG